MLLEFNSFDKAGNLKVYVLPAVTKHGMWWLLVYKRVLVYI